ncbi:calcium-binding protein [Streptomyces sp. NPDC014894]|uniref:calcium-binding protein n=1 Tax=Streptomyces sp. NPDC014894 TaxID=3364931 RepID=UPI0036FE4F92
MVTGALALTSLTAPAAQADDSPSAAAARSASAANGAKGANDVQLGDTKISKVVINGGKPVVAATADKTIKVSFTASDKSGIESADAFLWHGTEANTDGFIGAVEDSAKCGKGTTPTCTLTFVIEPWWNLSKNSLGTNWKVDATAFGNDGDFTMRDNVKSFNILRAAKLTVNATPEPVKKGKTLTVTGALTRINWETEKYAGYTVQPVKLQFRKKGAKTYSTLKTVKTDKKGNLKTTVKATVDGDYRYSFAGTNTTQAVDSGADAIDVR